MKKSKLVQNSRDLLSRSFNPSKCKTSLRLAGSRVKLLRNKKEVQVKQMKREIAQLLESGQDQTARIRVEHVIREEKMMAAYDLLEIYCELVTARLPIIESQKNCPIDLKEAIASLVFAAPRCGDIPELLDVRKQITAKYGKEFTTAAVELRPQCGVARMLVEKLSATAPNLETKTKILTTIAEEHNVKWEPKSFGEKDPGSFDDRLSGSLGKLSEQYPEPPPQAQVRPSNNMMSHLSPLDFVQQNDRTSEKLLFAQTSGSTTPYQYEARPPAPVDERSREDSNMYPPDRHRWCMEFKDATSAAQAAAESAERASIAARAAAELSSHNQISRQYSTEMHNSNVASSKYEGPPNSKSSNASNDRSSTEHGTRLQSVKQADECKPNNQKTTTSFEEDSAGSSQGHIPSFSSNPKDSIEEYSQKNSLNEVPNDEMGVEKQSFSYEAETGNSSPEEAENIEEIRTLSRHSIKSFRSQSSIADDNVNVFSNSEYKKLEKDAGKSPVVDGEASQMSTQESAALFFDKYDSDTDDGGFDVGPTYDEREESEIHLPFFGRKSPEKAPAVADSWSPPTDSPNKILPSTSPFFIDDGKSSDFSENTKSRNDSELNSAHVTFDESDGPFSDSDDDTKNPRRHTGYDSTDVHKRNEREYSVKSSFKHKYSSLFSDKDLQLSSDDELSPSLKVRWNNSNWDHMSVEDSPRKLSFIKPDANQPALEPKESLTEPKEIDTESNSESEQRLNFGKLTGGFRHKSHHNQLSFIKSRLNVPSDKESETTYSRFEEPEIGTTSDHKEISMMQDFHLASDTDNCEEELSQGSRGNLESKEVKTKPNFFISSDNRDAGNYSPKDHVRSGFSRRTKASPSIPKKDSYSEEVLDSDARIAKTPTTSSNSGTPKISESTLKNSSKLETYEHPKPVPARSNFWGPPPLAKASFVTKEEFEARDTDSSPGRKSENSYSPESQKAYEPQKKSSLFGNSGQATPVKLASKPTNSSSTSLQGSNVSQKSSVVEDPPGYKLKDQAPVGSNNVSSSNKEIPKKAAHVHPKLPDYDTLFQSLRMNRS